MKCGCGTQLKEAIEDGESLGFFCPNCINPKMIEKLIGVEFDDFEPEPYDDEQDYSDIDEGDFIEDSAAPEKYEEEQEEEDDGLLYGSED